MLDFIFSLSDRIIYISGVLSLVLTIGAGIVNRKTSDIKTNEGKKNYLKRLKEFFLVVSFLLFVFILLVGLIRYNYVIVPNVTNQNYENAFSILQASHINTEEVDEICKKLNVISQYPEPDSYVKKYSKIELSFYNDNSTIPNNEKRSKFKLRIGETKLFNSNNDSINVLAIEELEQIPNDLFVVNEKYQVKFEKFTTEIDPESKCFYYVFENVPAGKYYIHIADKDFTETNTIVSFQSDYEYDNSWGECTVGLKRKTSIETIPLAIYIGEEISGNFKPFQGYQAFVAIKNNFFYPIGYSNEKGKIDDLIFCVSGVTFKISFLSPNGNWYDYEVINNTASEIKLVIKDDTIHEFHLKD